MAYVLRFIAGQFEGGEFPLKPNREITIGRSSEFDMVLDEERVSRCHAKVLTFNGQVMIRDLGSTNGTFVNGERIEEAQLQPGDRVLVGSSVMECVFASDKKIGQAKHDAPTPANTAARTNATVSMSQHLRGCFPDDADLTEILTFWSESRRTGTLHIESDHGDFADIFFEAGSISGVRLKMADGEGFCSGARKSFFRVVAWPAGVFSFLGRTDDLEGRCDLTGDPRALVNDAVEQRAELQSLIVHVPPRSTRLVANHPLGSPLSDLSAEALDTFQAVYNLRGVGPVLDTSEATDLETCTDLLYLLQNDYIAAE